MAYSSDADLPLDVKALPFEAQNIWRSTFNAAVNNSADDPIEDADAKNLAWEAVKRAYVKEGDVWVLRGVLG